MSESEIDKIIKETLEKLRDAVEEMQEETEEHELCVRNGFVKSDNGSWFNISLIESFTVQEKAGIIVIIGWINGEAYRFFTGFTTEKEAREYLDYVIDKLDQEEAQ